MIPIHPLRKYHDYEGEEDGLPLAGVRNNTPAKHPRALDNLLLSRKKKKDSNIGNRQKAKA